MLYWIILSVAHPPSSCEWARWARRVWTMSCGPFVDYESANAHRKSNADFDGCRGHRRAAMSLDADIMALEHEEVAL